MEKEITNKHHRMLKREAGRHVRALLIEQKKLKTSHLGDLSALIHEFKSLYYLGAFLGLFPLCRMALLGLKYSSRLSGSEFPLPHEKYQILKKLIEQIVILFRQLEEIKDDGYYINHQEAVIRTASHDFDTTELERMFQKILISIKDDLNVHPLSVGKDKDFSHALKIPKNFMKAPGDQFWNVLIYLDLNNHEDLNKLINGLETLRKSGEMVLMGPFALPYDYFQESKIKAPFYFIFQSESECTERLKELEIKGKIVKILQKPEKEFIQKPLHTNPEVKQADREIIREVPFLPPDLLEKIDRIEQQTKEKEPLPSELDLKNPKSRKLGVRFSIGFKLILIISAIIITALTTMSVISFSLFQTTLSREIEENSLTVADLLSTNTERSFNSLRETLRVLLNNNRETLSETMINDYPYIMYFQLVSSDIKFSYPGFFSYDYINGVLEENYGELLDEAWNGDLNYRRTFNPSFYLTDTRNTDPLTGVLLTYWDEKDKQQKPMIILVKTSELLGDVINNSGSRSIFILNGKGELIGHPDQLLVTSSQQGEFENHPVLKHVRDSGSIANQQISYEQTMFQETSTEESIQKITMLGAYTAIADWDLFFISEIQRDVVFGPINDILKQNIYLMIMILSLAILLIYFFSKTITLPMARLMVATKMINRGIYELKLKARGHDETGVLTQAFVDMGQGLQERERMKDAFGRFVNAEVAEMAAKGELKLGGETKEATIFFSDIRSFTAISEQLSPDEVVEFLNEYMTAMVKCVTQTHGHVDKYIGDAIMALWGIPKSHGNDPENSIDCALAMREALIIFNKDRGGVKRPIIKIGCGINSGSVVSGQIGSMDRMEYTVIGDAVNLASRVEPLNKPMGTDILISTNTYNHVKGIYDVVPMNKIKVKGKSEPQQIYAVLGRMDNPDRPKNLDEMRAYVGIEGDFSHITNQEADEKEVKYEIMD